MIIQFYFQCKRMNMNNILASSGLNYMRISTRSIHGTNIFAFYQPKIADFLKKKKKKKQFWRSDTFYKATGH